MAKFLPGQSGNARGRPKLAAVLSKKILAATDDGAEIIDVLVKALRNRRSPTLRLRAAVILSDRAWGRPALAIELAQPGPDERRQRFDRSALSDAESFEYRRLIAKMMHQPAPEPVFRTALPSADPEVNS